MRSSPHRAGDSSSRLFSSFFLGLPQEIDSYLELWGRICLLPLSATIRLVQELNCLLLFLSPCFLFHFLLYRCLVSSLCLVIISFCPFSFLLSPFREGTSSSLQREFSSRVCSRSSLKKRHIIFSDFQQGLSVSWGADKASRDEKLLPRSLSGSRYPAGLGRQCCLHKALS